MHIEIRRWLTEPYHDIRRHKTTVTVVDGEVTAAVTLDGYFGRKAALTLVFNHLQREGRWSNDFLARLNRAV